MGEPSEVVRRCLDEAIDEATIQEQTDVLILIGSVNQMIDDLAEIVLDQEITFGQKFQAIIDMNYLSHFLEETMTNLKKEDVIKLMSNDPYDRIIDFLKDPL